MLYKNNKRTDLERNPGCDVAFVCLLMLDASHQLIIIRYFFTHCETLQFFTCDIKAGYFKKMTLAICSGIH